MSKYKIKELGSMKKIASSLTPQDVQKLQIILNIPSAIVEKMGIDALDYLCTLKQSHFQMEMKMFIDALRSIGRADLIPFAKDHHG